jgi:hypothetical protein
MKTSSTNNITRKVGIIVALKFENCNCGKKINEFMFDFFLCDSLEDKIVYVRVYHSEYKVFLCLNCVSVFNLWASHKKTHFYS